MGNGTSLRNEPAIDWPRDDYSRVPFRLYHDPEIYEQEQQRIFRGPTWNYLGLDVEIPNPGDFQTTFVGDTSVVVNRDGDGRVHAFVNRCAHRGGMVRRETRGNATDHTCAYHRWCYDLQGNLMGVPFRRGVRGKGGLPDDFDISQHCLRKLRVDSFKGLIFGTFSDETEPLLDYLGEPAVAYFERAFSRPIHVLGYTRQVIHGNWKLYWENVKDHYHGSLLHEFQAVFGLSRHTQEGGSKMDRHHRNSHMYAIRDSDSDEEAHQAHQSEKVRDDHFALLEPDVVKYYPEWDDGVTFNAVTIFPNSSYHQLQNTLFIRQYRTRSPDCFEVYATTYGYDDDDEAMARHRLIQSNQVGPGGLVSMDDGAATEMIQKATLREQDAYTVVEMGGRGEIKDADFKVNEMPIRGFWAGYAEMMGLAPEGAVR